MVCGIEEANTRESKAELSSPFFDIAKLRFGVCQADKKRGRLRRKKKKIEADERFER